MSLEDEVRAEQQRRAEAQRAATNQQRDAERRRQVEVAEARRLLSALGLEVAAASRKRGLPTRRLPSPDKWLPLGAPRGWILRHNTLATGKEGLSVGSSGLALTVDGVWMTGGPAWRPELPDYADARHGAVQFLA